MTLKKKKGIADKMLVTLISIFILFVFLIGSLNFIESTIKYIDAHQIARKYILKMESNSFISPDNINKLTTELRSKGFKNIDLSGSTTTKVSFGDDVVIDIKYDQAIRKITLNGLAPKVTVENTRIRITKSSTGKR